MLVSGTMVRDRYRVERCVGQGGMGAVYQALDQESGALVAIKQVWGGDARLRSVLDREARILAQLRHPALPRVHEYFAHDGGWCLVMEFIAGDDLAAVIQRSHAPIPLGDALRWADQLLDALEYLHARRPPVLHRDIKPRNLKLTGHGAIVLLDFGLAKRMDGHAADVSLPGYTLAYAPLEQIRGECTSPRSDLYALAATLYDMLTGVPPLNAVQRAATLLAGQPDPLRPAHELNPQVLPAVAALLHGALALDPTLRPASAAAMRLALHAASDPQNTVAYLPMSSPSQMPRACPHNLPAPPTPLIGRADELATIVNLVRRDDVRLVTLTGAAGIGKTRLSLDVAARLLGAFADGVFFVPLAPLAEPGLVASAIAQVLAVKAHAGRTLVGSLQAYLRDKRLLLLLDNFEQVLDAALLVAELLAAAPHLKVLATSRELLRLRGEYEIPVPPLALPPCSKSVSDNGASAPEIVHPASLILYPSVELFVHCAQAARLHFALDDANAPAVAAICARLDGLPLAIELAAARIRTLTPYELLARLERRLDLLTDGPRDLPVRQQTLRAAIAWSYDLLDADERRLFAQLAVFVGGCMLEAVSEVLRDEVRVMSEEADQLRTQNSELKTLEGLTALVDKSLVQGQAGREGKPRFVMLESIREYALERLAASGEQGLIERRHAHFFLALAERAEPELRGSEQRVRLDQLEAEHDNLRAAHSWAIKNRDATLALGVAAALGLFWRARGHLEEGRQRLESALELGQAAPVPLRAKALAQIGKICFHQSDLKAAQAYCEQSLTLYRELGDQAGIAWAWFNLGGIERDSALIQRHLSESLALFRMMNDRAGMAAALNELSGYERWRGDLATARAFAAESLSLYRDLSDQGGVAEALRTLGAIAMTQGDLDEALQYLEESVSQHEAIGDRHGCGWSLYDLGRALALGGDLSAARTCFARSQALFRELGDQAGLAWSLYGQGEAELYARNAAAHGLLIASLDLFRALDESWGIAWALARCGALACDNAEHERASDYFQEGLELHQRAGNKQGIAYIFEGYAHLALVRSQPERAAQLCAGAAALRATIGTPLRPIERVAYERLVAAIRARLDSAVFTVAWAAGWAMSVEALGAYAVEK